MWIVASVEARADVIGFRIDGRACRNGLCREMPGSPALWSNWHVCQGRASHLERVAAVMPSAAFGLPKGAWTVTARCTADQGLPNA